jgi:hypothetical protein
LDFGEFNSIHSTIIISKDQKAIHGSQPPEANVVVYYCSN